MGGGKKKKTEKGEEGGGGGLKCDSNGNREATWHSFEMRE